MIGGAGGGGMEGWVEVGGMYGCLGRWRNEYENMMSWQRYVWTNSELGPYYIVL